MPQNSLTIDIKIRWWLKPAILIVGFYCKLVGRKVQESTIDFLTKHGSYMETQKCSNQ